MRRVFLLTAPLLLLAAACAPKPPEIEAGPVRRNVSVETVVAKPVSLDIKIPVLLKAREEVELRATASGMILELPFEEGDVVPASAVPKSTWLDAEDFLKLQPGVTPTDEALLQRNLAHLDGLKTFAHIEDRAARIDFLDAQSRYDAATRTLNRALSYKDSTEAAIDSARTNRTAARASGDRLLHMIEDTYVTSPVSGVLKQRFRRAGEFVNMGELLGIVSVLDPLVAEFHVPEAHLESVKVGGEIDISVPSVADSTGEPVTVKATIRLVDSVAHAMTHSFRVEADIPNAERTLPAGVFGTTRLVIYRSDTAITVPLTALKLKGEAISMFVLKEDGTAREVTNVRLGHIGGEWAEVLGKSLTPGDKLVTTGAQMLADGDLVAVREDPTAEPAGKDGRP
jgi:membrane fusion protein, multidrug efflux system